MGELVENVDVGAEESPDKARDRDTILTNERRVLGVLTNVRRVLPDLAEPVELVRRLLANSRGRGAKQCVDDEV